MISLHMPVSHFSKVSQDYLPFTYIGEIMNAHVVCVGVKFLQAVSTHQQLRFQQSIYAGFDYYPVSGHFC